MGKAAEKVVIKTRWPVLGQWFLSRGKKKVEVSEKRQLALFYINTQVNIHVLCRQ